VFDDDENATQDQVNQGGKELIEAKQYLMQQN
jgi:hypothetical protein